MKARLHLTRIVVFVLCLYTQAFAEPTGPNAFPSPVKPHPHRVDRSVVLDARLAGVKAELKLNMRQDPFWGPFENAVREAFKNRSAAMEAGRAGRAERDTMSPLERLNTQAEHLAQASQDVKKIAEAAKPLYESLEEDQKHRFATLLHFLQDDRPGRGGMEHRE